MTAVPTITLDGSVEIPQLGFGVFQVPPSDTQGVVEQALETGYRHIDTAAAYRNEEGVGKAIAASGIPREDVFVTTKLWNDDQGEEPTRQAFKASLDRLGLDRIDLYLIHWPVPTKDLFVETWRAMEGFHEEGGARAIGVSNFRVTDLERLTEETEVRPALNQVELHPRFQQAELRSFHSDRCIVTESWSPLAQGQVLEDAAIGSIAKKHDRTPAQAILRWQLQLGNVVIPKSVTPERIAENLDLFGFQLDGDDIETIAGLDSGERIGPDPATFVSP